MYIQIRELAKLFHLNEDSLFIDVGGYDGDFTKHIFLNFNCRSILFEPYFPFFKKCQKRFKRDDRVCLINAGLGKADRFRKIYEYKEGTSLFKEWHKKKEEQGEWVYIMNTSNFLKNFKIDGMKLNCEGAEYEIIDNLYQSGEIKNIKEILIEFHLMKGHTYERTQEILSKTHLKETYHSKDKFIWEMWTRK